jgi:glycosyltransferase involved in cell wall biosynthesis
MSAYNAAPYLQAALDSLYTQTFCDFEIIAINDGSTDDTLSILKKQSDPRLHWLDNGENRGVIFSVNRGLSEARGEYIARFDADDLCRPERLELQVNFLDSNRNCDIVCGFIQMFDDSGKDCGQWTEDRLATNYLSIRQMLPKRNCIAQSTVMFRHDLLNNYKYRKISLNPRYFAEDYDLWLRLAADGKRIEKINQVLADYRLHSNSASVSCDNRKLAPRFFSLKLWFEFKDITTKLIFFFGQLRRGHCRLFELKTLHYALHEAAWKIGSKLKHSMIRKSK